MQHLWEIISPALLAPILLGGTLLGLWESEVGSAQPPRREKSFKGWELYAQKGVKKNDWTFGLLPGTNRQKTPKEIAASMTIEGVGQLEKELSRLASGDTVVVQTKLPEKIFGRIEAHCKKENLELLK